MRSSVRSTYSSLTPASRARVETISATASTTVLAANDLVGIAREALARALGPGGGDTELAIAHNGRAFYNDLYALTCFTAVTTPDDGCTPSAYGGSAVAGPSDGDAADGPSADVPISSAADSRAPTV